MENIKNLVFQFRNAIELAKKNGETDSMRFFEKFPTGCCGETSDFLGHFLLEHGIQTSYICRSCPPQNEEENSQHHAWLLLEDDTIIDITGDQFKDNVASRDCPWERSTLFSTKVEQLMGAAMRILSIYAGSAKV